MAAMNRGLNLPGIQKIMNEFERESSMMDMKGEMMSDAVDEVMDEEEDEEEEGDKILKEVLDEIGVSLAHEVRSLFTQSIAFDLILSHYNSSLTPRPGLQRRHLRFLVDNLSHWESLRDLQDLFEVQTRKGLVKGQGTVYQMKTHYKHD